MALFPLSWLNQPLSENRHVGVINLSYSIITAPGAIKASFSSSSSSQGRVGPSSFNASPAPHHRTADNKRNQKQPNRSCTRSRKSLLRLTMTSKERDRNVKTKGCPVVVVFNRTLLLLSCDPTCT